MRRQHLARPGRAPPLPRRPAMVAVVERGEPAAVPPEAQGPPPLGLGVETHVVHRIAERVLDRPPAAVERLSREMIDPEPHSAAIPMASSFRIAATTSTAEASPSSWKPFFIQAPQNHVAFCPLIARTVPCAASAARS
jgi:hypothetical protein